MSKPAAVEPPSLVGSKIRMDIVGLIAAIVAVVVVMLLPTPQGLSPEGHRLAALFIAALIMWSTEAIPIAMTSVLVLALQPIFGLGPLGAAFTSFISPPFFFVLVMFAIAFAWVKTGLAKRFALWMISKAGTDTKRTVYVFMFGTGLISTIVSDVPCAAIFMAIAIGIFDKLGLQPGKSSFGKAVMMGIPIASLIGGVGTPAGSSINILGLNIIEQNGGARVPFLHWMAIGMPMVIILLPIAAWVICKFYPPEIKTIGNIEEIHRDRREMGSMSAKEKKVLVVMAAMLVFWIASTWYPAFDTTLVAILGACVMFLPGMNIFDWKEVQGAVGWDALLMIGGVTSLGQLSGRTGLAKWMADSTLSGLADWNIILVIAFISAFIVLIHLMLPINPVIVVAMIPPIMVLANTAGVNPALYALPVIFTASCAFLLPLDAVPLVTYGKGYYRMFDMFVPGMVISAIWVVVMTALLLMIGPLVGLI